MAGEPDLSLSANESNSSYFNNCHIKFLRYRRDASNGRLPSICKMMYLNNCSTKSKISNKKFTILNFVNHIKIGLCIFFRVQNPVV